MAKYTIMLQTPRKPKAGTNADVEARILGTHGASAWRVLDLPNVDDREQGSQDYYRLEFDDSFGDITGLELRVKKADEVGPEWLLETAYICRVSSRQLYKLPYNQWINPTSHTNWVYARLTSLQPEVLNESAFGVTNQFLW
ncbi:PLAT/LH2 domain-containing protein [Spirosoma foliorum]|uniref:PLAT domain-containing protein n=1 Tax=Spirosoma foliorum TaxID=2710596 RepID=A0A7G5H1H0_9BACT|nr:PLAT/LH2 domain-containing protein [Spirosoma foliorum]QMW04962.1 hypothetical protein H3H32_08720 [Spirosoma foliorum]